MGEMEQNFFVNKNRSAYFAPDGRSPFKHVRAKFYNIIL